jgi:beta-galactosidase
MRLLTLAVLFLGLQASAQRVTANFDDSWTFHFGNASDPAKDFNFGTANIFSKTGAAQHTAIDPKFNDSGWRHLSLPHDWAVELPFVNSPSFDVMSHGYKPVGGLFPETSIGWYRKRFTVDRADSGQRFQLQFDGIFRNAQVWINGFYLGNHQSGYTGVAYDLADYLNYGHDNVVVVRVDATQYEGWFYEGAGIYRHVWLNKYPNTHIAENGVYVYSSIHGTDATVNVETTVQNQALNGEAASVSFLFTDRDGKVLARSAAQTLRLAVNELRTVKQTVHVSTPKLWSLDDPYLYRVIVDVKSANNQVDRQTLRFGLRTVSITKDGVFLNGKYVKIQGTNNHQDHAGVGSAMPDYLYQYRVRLLKQLGTTAFRTSHNPPAPALLDACDSLGMLVLDENRLLNSSPQYMSDLEWLLKRDRSRTCVFLWSIGNEEGWVQGNSTGRRIAQTLLAKQKELDPTRVSTYAADMANVYRGINEVIPVRGFNYRQFAVEAYHKDHPDQPVTGTEMGSTVTTRGIYVKDSIKGYVPDQDITAPWWASKAEAWWSLAAAHPWWTGGFVWTGFDYRGEPTPFQWPNISSHFGIMDACGFPKNIYYYYQSWWTDNDVLHLSPHWNWKGREGQPVDVWVNTNADNVELYLNGKSLGKKDMPRNSHLQWSVPYEAGTLEAIAYKKGRKLTTKVETTGPAAEVVMAPSKTTMLGDGKDITVLNISVIDKQGHEVPDADNLITFSVTGRARIIGTGNGDPSSHEQDSYDDTLAQRHLFNGHCQVIIRGGTGVYMFHAEARSAGLQTGATDISVIRPGAPHTVSDAQTWKARPVDRMLGADISFLPQLEGRGIKFHENGKEVDAVQLLKEHGMNYVRLRIFNDPARDSGYAPGKGYCDLQHTLQMAKRVKAAGMKLLLDFHYSDYWADPQKQYMPAAWRPLAFPQLQQAVYTYTRSVMQALKDQGTTPEMVQVGNEINHGVIWPAGAVNNLDSLAQLLNAGIRAVRSVAPATYIMLHVALGGQNDEARFFMDQMLRRGVNFDVIGLSYYPKWHGTLADLDYNLNDLASRYHRDVIVVEYSQRKQEVNDLAFNVANGHGKGTCIWEPLNTWEGFFDKSWNANAYLPVYDSLSRAYLKK